MPKLESLGPGGGGIPLQYHVCIVPNGNGRVFNTELHTEIGYHAFLKETGRPVYYFTQSFERKNERKVTNYKRHQV